MANKIKENVGVEIQLSITLLTEMSDSVDPDDPLPDESGSSGSEPWLVAVSDVSDDDVSRFKLERSSDSISV